MSVKFSFTNIYTKKTGFNLTRYIMMKNDKTWKMMMCCQGEKKKDGRMHHTCEAKTKFYCVISNRDLS